MSQQLYFALNGTGLDASATAFINAVQNGGYTMSGTEKNAINTLVSSLKANGLWNKLYAFYPFIGNTGNSHMWNLKNPIDSDTAFRLAFTGSPSHSISGCSFNGSTQYADTKIVPSSILSQNNMSMGMYINGGTNTNPYGHGAVVVYASSCTELYYTTGNINFSPAGENQGINNSATYSNNNIVIGNTDGANTSVWYGGSQIASRSYTAGTLPNVSIYIGAVNRSGSGAVNLINCQVPTFFIAQNITGFENTMTTIIHSFNSTLSR